MTPMTHTHTHTHSAYIQPIQKMKFLRRHSLFPLDEPKTSLPLQTNQHSVDSSSTRSLPLKHGQPPFFECWAFVRVNGSKPVLRFCTLSGPHVCYSAAPGHQVFPESFTVYNAVVFRPFLQPRKILILLHGTRITLQLETRRECAWSVGELQRAATRSFYKDYSLDGYLGDVLFGHVLKAEGIHSSEQFVVKIADKHTLTLRHVACIKKEAVVLLSMPEHVNVSSIADVYECEQYVYSVIRAPNGDTLSNVIRKRGSICEADAAAIVKGLLCALVHLRQCKVVHRLICPENVLLVPGGIGIGTALLANFELAVSAVNLEDRSCILKTFEEVPWTVHIILYYVSYFAPEVAAGGVGGYEQDVWSVGILMHYLLVGCTPFEFEPGVEHVDRLVRLIASVRGMPSFTKSLWRGVTSDAKNLCASLLHADPNSRPTAESALEHQWFKM